MDNWLDTIRQVLCKLWMSNKISAQEYQNFMISAKSGVKYSDIYAGHKPLTSAQQVLTKIYFTKSQNNS